MKVIYPKNQVIKTTKIPNWLLFNRFLFGLLKLFLLTKNIVFLRVKYKQIKPVIKMAKHYKDFEIVNVKSRQGDEVKILL